MITVKKKDVVTDVVMVVAGGHQHHDGGAGRCSCDRENQLSCRQVANQTVESKKNHQAGNVFSGYLTLITKS